VIYKEIPYVTFCERIALWRMTDIHFNTQIRDGMNVFLSEYVVARTSSSNHNEYVSGCALVSEFSGSSLMMSGALRINPWQTEKVADAIDRALNMSQEEQSSRLEQDAVAANHGSRSVFLKKVLSDVQEAAKGLKGNDDIVAVGNEGLGVGVTRYNMKLGFKPLDFDKISADYKASTKRVILLDSRGTLMPLSNFAITNKKFRPRSGSPQIISVGSFIPRMNTGILNTKETTLPLGLAEKLEILCSDPANTVVIAGGATRTEIFKQFGRIKKLSFAAEHGFYINWYNTRSLLGGHDPSGNTGWELLGGHRLGTRPAPGTPSCILHIKNQSNRGVWMRCLRANGGFHGFDIPSFTHTLDFYTHADVFCIAFMWYTKGDDFAWNPIDTCFVESNCTVTISAGGKIKSTAPPPPDKTVTLDAIRPVVASLKEYVSQEWKTIAKAIMQKYNERTSGTYLEMKDTSILWRFRDTDPEFGTIQAKELFAQLEKSLRNFPVEVLAGKDYVEVRPEGVNKGSLAQFVLSAVGGDADFVLAVGDDTADETMFSALETETPKHVYTCTVGKKPSGAKAYLDDHTEVGELIQCLVDASKEIAEGKKLEASLNKEIDVPVPPERRHPPRPVWKPQELPYDIMLARRGSIDTSTDEAGDVDEELKRRTNSRTGGGRAASPRTPDTRRTSVNSTETAATVTVSRQGYSASTLSIAFGVLVMAILFSRRKVMEWLASK
jgi:trehalose-6-phosphatase